MSEKKPRQNVKKATTPKGYEETKVNGIVVRTYINKK